MLTYWGISLRARRFLSFLAVSAVLATATGCASTPPPVSDKVQAYYDANVSPSLGTAASPQETDQPESIPIKFSEGTKSVIFGDSWTAGLFMDPATDGYAYRFTSELGLDAEVLGGNGTGYLNAGSNGLGGYKQRLSALPVGDANLLIIQGSVNDFGKNLADLGPAFDEATSMAKEKFPAAQIVILGPSTAQWPVQSALMTVDGILAERSANAGLAYISPYMGQWISEKNFSDVIDPETGHPSADGHAYLAAKVVETLKARQAK